MHRLAVTVSVLLVSVTGAWPGSPVDGSAMADPAIQVLDPAKTGGTLSQSDTTSLQALLARYDRLPDLREIARASGKDLYTEQERLAREHDALKKPYRLTMPYRNPGGPCKSGAHTVAMMKHTLVNPAHNERVELWEMEMHEAREHGAALPPAAAAWLARLKDAD
jgi:hypothetical protein